MIDRSKTTILVTGATGRQGSAVAEKLLADGWKLRALTRDPQKPAAKKLAEKGIEVVKGDLKDRASLDNALKGVCGVFAVLTPLEEGIESEIIQGKNLVDAAKDAAIRHFVYSSVIAANLKTGIPHFDSKDVIENYLRESGIKYTILRPSFFMYNFESSPLKESILDGTLPLAIRRDVVHQMLAPEDFAHFVALAFANPKEYIGKEIDIAGDEMTMTEAAECFGRVLGRPVHYKELPVEDVIRQSEEMGKMFKWYNETDYRVDIEPLKQLHPNMMGLETYLREHGWESEAVKYGRAA